MDLATEVDRQTLTGFAQQLRQSSPIPFVNLHIIDRFPAAAAAHATEQAPEDQL